MTSYSPRTRSASVPTSSSRASQETTSFSIRPAYAKGPPRGPLATSLLLRAGAGARPGDERLLLVVDEERRRPGDRGRRHRPDRQVRDLDVRLSRPDRLRRAASLGDLERPRLD